MHSDSKSRSSFGWANKDRHRVQSNEHVEPDGDKGRSKKKAAPLDSQAKLLLAVQGMFAAGNALSTTFVNVYLWKARHDFTVIGWFTLIHHLSMAITFWIAGKWVKEHNKMNCLRSGVFMAALFYLLVLLLGSKAVDTFWLLAIVQGMSAGFFWLAFNVVYFEVTDPDNRDKFNGWTGLLGSFAGMVAPWISGFLITRMAETSGYRLVFSLSLATFVVGIIISFFLKKRKAEGKYEWLLTYRCLKESHSEWRKVGVALAAQGVREGVFGFVIALMVYVATGTEMQIGNFSLVTSGVGLISFWLCGKLLKPVYRKWTMPIGAFAIVAVIVPFFWQVSYTTLLIFGIGVAIFFPLYMIPMISEVFDLIGRNEESAKKREEYIVLRELGLNAGRIMGTLVFTIVVMLNPSTSALIWLLIGIGSSPIVVWLFMREQLNHSLPKSAPVKK